MARAVPLDSRLQGLTTVRPKEEESNDSSSYEKTTQIDTCPMSVKAL
jgi:hypothetical protein